MTQDVVYDLVYIGSSPISVIDAYCFAKQGKSIAMIDDHNDIGGAWRCLENPYLYDVENAIHYFLPDEDGRKFMINQLNLNIVEVKEKFRVFKFPFFGFVKLSYHNIFSKCISELVSSYLNKEPLKEYLKIITETLAFPKIESFFIKGGSPELLNRIFQLKNSVNIDMLLNATIKDIQINTDEVSSLTYHNGVQTTKLNFRTLNISHGSKISGISVNNKRVEVIQKVHPRPSFHLFVEDNTDHIGGEWIFYGHHLFKYVHNITRYTRPKAAQYKDIKVLVFALQPNIACYDGIEGDIHQELIAAGMLTPQSKVIHSIWTDIFLPMLDDDDLEKLSQIACRKITFLKTENFVRGIGLRHKNWEKFFNNNLPTVS